MATKKSSIPRKSAGLQTGKAATVALQEDVPPQQRIAFIRGVKLVGLGLDDTVASVDRDALAKARQADARFDIDLKIDQYLIIHAKDHFIVGSKCELRQLVKGSEASVLTISVAFSARFNLPSPAPENLVQAFAGLEARLVFFPYLRHYISDMTYRMGVGSIVLPLTSELE